jgi:lysine-N-methylase
MAVVIRHLPIVQNWDCHQSGSCCKEYQVAVTDEERQRIEAQGWDRAADLGGLEPFKLVGPPWNRRHQLNHRADGSCVFLSEQGRCRIHERHGFASKPLPCRLFPFVLVPVADHWRVGLRFACPSAAASKGRAIPEHDADLKAFADMLAEREGVKAQVDGSLVPPPKLQAGQRVEWPDVLRIVQTLIDMMRNRRDPIELRMRKCLTLAKEMRKARLDNLRDQRLGELLVMMRGVADVETPTNPRTLPVPGWVGRVLFRQSAALFTRKDHGPNSGVARSGRTALFWAAWRFARGTGVVPRLHRSLPEVTFTELEIPRGPLPVAAEEVLERYYTVKLSSLQFCGPTQFGMGFWEGFELLALTLPILLWVARMFRNLEPEAAVAKAMTIVDDHFGFNPLLGSMRQRYCFWILASSGELSRLIAWYAC